MADFCKCSACGADLRGPFIPIESRYLYGGHDTCPLGCDRGPHFSRLIGIYGHVTDRTVAGRCPDCGHEEARRDRLRKR